MDLSYIESIIHSDHDDLGWFIIFLEELIQITRQYEVVWYP